MFTKAPPSPEVWDMKVSAPTEVDRDFLQGMINRMAISYAKYGEVKDAMRGHRVDAMKTAQLCIDAYNQDGNTEHLMDAANYLMMEFMFPQRDDARFEATDSEGSVGRVWKLGNTVTTQPNVRRA